MKIYLKKFDKLEFDEVSKRYKTTVIETERLLLREMNDDDFVSLTDIARIKNPKEPKDMVKNWMRLRSTQGFLGL